MWFDADGLDAVLADVEGLELDPVVNTPAPAVGHMANLLALAKTVEEWVDVFGVYQSSDMELSMDEIEEKLERVPAVGSCALHSSQGRAALAVYSWAVGSGKYDGRYS